LRRLLFLCLGIALVATAIGVAVLVRKDGASDRPAGERTKGSSVVTRHCRAGEVALGSRRVSFTAFLRTRAEIYRRPGGARLTTLPRLSKSFVATSRRGVPTVVAALAEVRASDCGVPWYRVRLSGAPGVSGATEGYAPADSVALAEVHARVVVDLYRRRLTLYENGAPVLEAPAAVGAPATPTPRGRFVVRERIRITNSSSAFGAAAIGLSAFSEKLIDWPQGGPVAIHGTSDPDSIGKAVSHGCVRLGARDLKRLFKRVQIGTPVEIVE
jgi:lipoprotein-anchoring transpeptidase ErfK/SrfK